MLEKEGPGDCANSPGAWQPTDKESECASSLATRGEGFKRLSCPTCGAGVYATWHAVESHPLPVCGACDEPFIPELLELAAAVLSPAQLEASDVGAEYGRALASAMHGQAEPARRRVDGGAAFKDPAQLAAERVERSRRDSARRRQLAAIRPVQPAMPF